MSDSFNEKDSVIALETSISGGSFSLFVGGEEIDSWAGADNLSRSEDVPEVIDTLLNRNRIARERIELIAASVGLGSFTGTRIGLATALGLRKALGCRLVRVPLLSALAEEAGPGRAMMAAVMVNKREVGWQVFAGSGAAPVPDVCLFTEFLDRLSEFAGRVQSSAFGRSLFESVRSARPELIDKNVRDAGDNLAKYVGRWAIMNPSDRNDQRVYSTGFRNSLP